ncbi:MAG: YceI family protein, partial [Bacteriovoracaceae bacterium]|nr:YceI family protein [Bacteriovoracaceae bacterium]
MKTFLNFLFINLLFISVSIAGPKKGISVSVNLSPAGSFEIKGKVKGKVSKKDGGFFAKKLSFKVKRLKTGMELRDKHTKDKLEFKSHPNVVVKNAKGSGGKGTASISVRGVTKKIGFKYSVVGKYVKAIFKLNLKDFKFSGINYMGVGVKDKVTVTAVVPIK